MKIAGTGIAVHGLALLGLVLCVPSAMAASFDCSKARTPYAKAICTDPGLSKADDEAFFGTDEDVSALDTVVKDDTTWLLRPYYSKVSPRRGLGAPYTLMIEPQAPGTAPPAALHQWRGSGGKRPSYRAKGRWGSAEQWRGSMVSSSSPLNPGRRQPR